MMGKALGEEEEEEETSHHTCTVYRPYLQTVARIRHGLVVFAQSLVAPRQVPVGLCFHGCVLALVRGVNLLHGVREHVAILSTVAMSRGQVPEGSEPIPTSAHTM